ncbi:phosphoribosylanthranilate isomerase [Chloroflexota bacterium]
MVRVKICGITNLEDALAALKWGADALGFVFAPSPRQVTRQQAANIIAVLPPFVCKAGVFVNSELEEVKETIGVCGLDMAQLHGSEDPDYCQTLFPKVIKAFRVKDESVLELIPRYKASAYLLDSYDATLKGGTGQCFNWEIAKKATSYGQIILSGGLTPVNIYEAITRVRPYAVDVSSGVENQPGKKDHDKLRAFLAAAKGEGERI